MNKRKGFTLVEIIVILAVIAILVGVAVPVALRIFERTAEDATREEMDNIKKAIIGDLRKLQSSFRSDFGYLGDIGCLPDDLRRIFRNDAPPLPSSLSTWAFDSTKQTGAGWKGPYITGSAGEEFDKDQWGNAYTFTSSGCTAPLTATLTSSGASTSLTSDDITLSIVANETTATTVRGSVKDMAGVGLGSIPVEFYAANNGTLPGSPPTTNTDANGNYSFGSVPFGARAVRAVPPALLFLLPGSPTTQNNGEWVIFTVVNYSGTAITITSINVTWTSSTGTRYDEIYINQVQVDPSGASGDNITSGTTVNITDTTIAANPTPSPSMRVSVDSTDTKLPDIKLSTGTTATFRIVFENNDDMRGGRDWTVVLNHAGGPSTVTFVIP